MALIVGLQIPKSNLLYQLQLCDLGPGGPSCLSLCIYKLGQYPPHLLPVRIKVTCVGQSRAWLVEGHSVKHTDISIQWLLESLDIEDIIQPAVAMVRVLETPSVPRPFTPWPVLFPPPMMLVYVFPQ